MSVGYITRRLDLWFGSCLTSGVFRPEVRYSTSDGHAGNFGQKRSSAPESHWDIKASALPRMSHGVSKVSPSRVQAALFMKNAVPGREHGRDEHAH